MAMPQRGCYFSWLATERNVVNLTPSRRRRQPMPDAHNSPAAETEVPFASVVFFDGDCIFCNHSVQSLIALDDDETLRFAPLQGEAARRALPEDLRQTDSLNTLVYLDPRGRIHQKSGAILRVLARIGGPYLLAAIALAMPRAWRDAAYDLVARNRKRLLSQRACALPAPGDRWRFLS